MFFIKIKLSPDFVNITTSPVFNDRFCVRINRNCDNHPDFCVYIIRLLFINKIFLNRIKEGDWMIRPMTAEDLESVSAIYNEAILNTTSLYRTHPETLEERKQWFIENEKEHNPMFVYEEDGEVAGFATFKRFYPNEGYKYSMEHSVYVSSKHQGKGIGKKLLQTIIEEAKKRNVRTLVAVIDSENIASIKLHEQFGFHLAGRLKNIGYKFGKWLDIEYYQLHFY